jgi:LytS/YehU family sensor histidine kinase
VVSSTRVMDELILQVTDNGSGLQENYNEGIGLRNTRERLKQLYGENQAVRLSSAPDKGTTVTITLPYREAEKEVLQADDEDQDAYRGRRTAGATTDTFTAFE